jgi:hypothetical protein
MLGSLRRQQLSFRLQTKPLVDVGSAAAVLRGMLAKLGTTHEFLPDDQASTRDWPAWCRGTRRSTDAHLLALAEQHGARLGTLDERIPEAFVVPD